MTRVYFVRHGHPSPAVCRAEPDPALSSLGFRQAQAAAERLSGSIERPRVLSSSARRAHQTATVIAEQLGAAVVVDPELSEIRGAGDADNETRERVSRLWRTRDLAARHPDGETLGEALDRFASVLSRAVETYPGDDLVLVSHGAFVVMGLLHLCEHDWDPMTVAGLVHCAVLELEIHRASAVSLGRVRSWEPDGAEQRNRA
jgi:broad specificity phosphatase PhoE